jgi:hypothetical protein
MSSSAHWPQLLSESFPLPLPSGSRGHFIVSHLLANIQGSTVLCIEQYILSVQCVLLEICSPQIFAFFWVLAVLLHPDSSAAS